MFKQNYTPTDFDELAEHILNNIVISSNNTQFRICELEIYYRNDAHKDEYVHKTPDQKSHGKFYFHKYPNQTFKSGTYKGIDIALGNGDTYFGILIRSVKNLETGQFTEGSCNCVNQLLKSFNVDTVQELFDKFYKNIKQIPIDDNTFKLIKTNLEKEQVYKGPRIGLSDKYLEFRDLHYRYATHIANIKKKRKTFVKV
jgi:3-methyladenine DNA glycosylase Mpg